MRAPYLSLLLLVLVLVIKADAQDSDCTGMLGSFHYNLRPLYEATRTFLPNATDTQRNTYFYRPCSSVGGETDCAGPTAVCQRDSRKIPQYYPLGVTNQVSWYQRNVRPDSGFFIEFAGGEDDRRVDIEFICDTSAGRGRLEAAYPWEQPMHFYHLIWRTSFACPLTPDPVNCCQYSNGKFYTCSSSVSPCLSTLGSNSLTANTTIKSCADCTQPTHNCCFYALPEMPAYVVSNCYSSGSCPVLYEYNGASFHYAGGVVVDKCSDCFVSWNQ